MSQRSHAYVRRDPPTRSGLQRAILDNVRFIKGVSITEKGFVVRVGIQFRWWTRLVPFLRGRQKRRAIAVLDAVIPLGITYNVTRE